MKTYDCFLFFNELDLLEIRLNLLNEYVDFFVISESTITFSGNKKPLYYEENKDRFKKFHHKIIHQIIDDTPEQFINLKKFEDPKNKDEVCLNKIYNFIEMATNFPKEEKHWGRDFFQRECLHRAMENCSDEDIVIFSDVDEIPKPETIKRVLSLFPSEEIYTLRQKEYNYYLNLYKGDGWMGPRVANYRSLKNISLNYIRAIIPGDRTMIDTIDVQDGGWHFTSLGGTEMIIKKIESWGHQEFNNSKIKDRVAKNVAAGKDIFQRRGSKKSKKVEMSTDHFPSWLVSNIDKYDHLLVPLSTQEVKKSIIDRLLGVFCRK